MTTAVTAWFQRHLSSYSHPAVRRVLFLGFASALPFPLVLMTLSARLQQAGIERTTIGTFSLVGLAYSLKFFWSPVVDRLRLPGLDRLGQRRSWMLLAQCGVIAGLVLMAVHDPASDPLGFALLATFTALPKESIQNRFPVMYRELFVLINDRPCVGGNLVFFEEVVHDIGFGEYRVDLPGLDPGVVLDDVKHVIFGNF